MTDTDDAIEKSWSGCPEPTTAYDEAVTQAYANLCTARSPFQWLSRILEDRALDLLPADRDCSVLDLACGIGSFCAGAVARGFSMVVGTDVSCSQVELARSIHGSKARFEVADARATHMLPSFREAFDVVNASWLYDTACDVEDAIAMARSARACLRPGGRHQGLEVNPAIKASEPFELEAFGLALIPDKLPGYTPNDGERISATLKTGPSPNDLLTTHVTYFDESTLRRIFVEAGFREIAFQEPATWQLHPNTDAETRAQFDRYIATNPEMISFTALA